MSEHDVRILLLADSHLGFDLPLTRRVQRRRRGDDFLANYAAALKPALTGEVDIVVHAGDVFDRSKVISTLAYQALEPLRLIAERDIPVFIVPGNHERSRLPHVRFASHPGVHLFDQPRTFLTTVRGTTIAMSGFPYERDVRTRFVDVVERTGWRSSPATFRVLCMHQCVEGATVGPGNFTFTTASDVICLRDVPRGFVAIMSGHIHRHQVLTRDLSRRPIATPVLYPGSLERTALAEIGEPKGYMIVHVGMEDERARARWEFRQLPARPMIRREITVDSSNEMALVSAVREIISAVPSDAVLSIRVSGTLSDAQWRSVSSARLRALAPPTMNVDVTPTNGYAERPFLREGQREVEPNLSLFIS